MKLQSTNVKAVVNVYQANWQPSFATGTVCNCTEQLQAVKNELQVEIQQALVL